MKTVLIAMAALLLLATASWAKASGTFYFMVFGTSVTQAGPFSNLQACNAARGTLLNMNLGVAISDCYSAQ